MTQRFNYFRASVLLILLNCTVFEALAVSISARRLYLDPQINTTDIRVLNMKVEQQNCQVEIRDIKINDNGFIELTANNTINSAKPLVRLAPRRFTLDTNGYQMVKLLYRRRPGVENGEYQGVLAIQCQERLNNTADQNQQVIIKPSLIHNVPVIVRTGRLSIEAEFTTNKILDNSLEVTLKITGQRSLTGDLTLIDTKTGETIATLKDKSIYAQQPVQTFTFDLVDKQQSNLLIRFTENPKFGGELIVEQLIK